MNSKLTTGGASETQFVGNLRIIKSRITGAKPGSSVYLVRKLSGELLLLSVPKNMDQLDSTSPYFKLDSSFESKNLFKLRTMEGSIADAKTKSMIDAEVEAKTVVVKENTD